MKHIIFAAGLALTLAYPVQAADKPADKKPATEKKASTEKKVKKHKKAEGTKVPEAVPAKKDDKKKKQSCVDVLKAGKLTLPAFSFIIL